VLILVLSLISACSQHGAPTNRLIKGPFEITTEWQTIELDRPLEVLPNIHNVDVLFEPDECIYDDDIPTGGQRIIQGGFRRRADGLVIDPEVILVEQSGREFHAFYYSNGSAFTDEGTYLGLGFGANIEQGKFFYPKGTKIVAIRVRANTTITVAHFWWVVYGYERARVRTWESIPTSKFISFE
jgi:hypothetical protein